MTCFAHALAIVPFRRPRPCQSAVRMTSTGTAISRRAALVLAAAALALPRPAPPVHARPATAVAERLAGVVRVRDALAELSAPEADAVAGARDLRRTLQTLLRGTDLRADAAAAARRLEAPVRDNVRAHVDSAREYIDLATGYFDAQGSSLSGSQRAFALRALEEALAELDRALEPFGQESVAEARRVLEGTLL